VDADALLLRLTELGRLEAPADPGLYAYFIADGAMLPGISNPGGGPVDVGLSSNLSPGRRAGRT
jgi:hypothetical protein